MSGANYDKLRLGATLSAHDGDNNNHGDCFNYGSVGGCDDGCPAMLNNRCEIYDSNFVERAANTMEQNGHIAQQPQPKTVDDITVDDIKV